MRGRRGRAASDAGSAGDVAACVLAHGAFNPPIAAGDTQSDLPENKVAYRRGALTETCVDISASDASNKPFFHERIRARVGRLVIRPTIRMYHLTHYPFLALGARLGYRFGSVGREKN